MCTYNAISSHTDHFEIQKRDSEKSLLTFVNLFPRVLYVSVALLRVIISYHHYSIQVNCASHKVRKKAKIRNRWNQMPHMTQET